MTKESVVRRRRKRKRTGGEVGDKETEGGEEKN